MAAEPDPYRTLGLPPTASLAEVKAAYRRLAKANHPDAAGEAALTRFLAIQAAYERLVGPTTGRSRSSNASPARARKPWEADPDRSQATHRAYGGRGRRPSGQGTGPPGRTAGAGGRASDSARASDPTGDTGRSGAPGSSGGRAPKKATLGSTSYDQADHEAFEPDWGGASWYGTTSGTYWTINPKEYADPRKHGPEYLARARRAPGASRDDSSDDGVLGATEPATVAHSGGASGPPDGSADGARSGNGTDVPRHTTTSWWEATSGPATSGPATAGPAAAGERASDVPPRAAPRPRPATPRPATEARTGDGPSDRLGGPLRALTEGAPPSPAWRLARAIIGWLPIGLAIGWASGEITGCGRFAAECDTSTAPLVWVLQLVVLGILMALPRVAGLAVVGALVSLVVAVPVTLFVTASAGAEASNVGTAFLGVALGLAWFAGVIGALVLGRRLPSRPTGPVS